MTKKQLKQEVKEQLKKKAVDIRSKKTGRKEQARFIAHTFGNHVSPWQLGYISSFRIPESKKPNIRIAWESLWRLESSLLGLKDKYRHIHIAYCEFFNNTPREAIERKCDVAPNEANIVLIKESWNLMLDKVSPCSSAG